MKSILVIPDGTADEPQSALDGLTPLQAARVPNMDRVAKLGRVGRADHVPASMPSGSDVGTMSLFGYNPLTDHTGRAPIEAAAMGISLGDRDWAVRCNLITIENERMRSFTAGQIPSDVGAKLIAGLQANSCGDPNWKFVPGVSYRNLAIYRARDNEAPFGSETRTVPPHDVTDQEIVPYLPDGPGADELRGWMEKSRDLFAMVEENTARAESGELPATQIWLWGQGRKPSLTPFREKYGASGAVITAVDLLRGMGKLLGWEVIEVEGATGYLDTDYAAKGRAAIERISDFDFLTVHVEATDEASHEGDVAAKVKALEEIDTHIVGPVLDHLESLGEYRMLICPDHPTFLRTKTHSHGYVPFAMCGTGIDPDATETYDEVAAEGSGFVLDEGYRLMGEFLPTVD